MPDPTPELPQPIPPVDLDRLTTYSITEREHLVQATAFAQPVEPDADLGSFLDALPDLLAVRRLRELATAIARARAAGKRVLLGLGGHVIKVGLGPLIADMVRRGLVTDVAFNGSSAIHDFEIALTGGTSERVRETIADGRFGMVTETAAAFARIARAGAEGDRGLGRALVEELSAPGYPHADKSLALQAARAGAQLTVHIAIGTDTVHAVPGADGAALGAASHIDFRRLAAIVSELSGGVYLNVGSAVVLPEVFLKAVAVARNLGHPVAQVTSANLDMLQHYRPTKNVLQRPVERGIALTGHHEIMLPLLRAEALRRLSAEGGPRPTS